MDKNSKIYIAGHNGLVGSAILRFMMSRGYNNIIFRSHSELDLTDQIKVREFFKNEKPEYVFCAAARVGGILANIEYPAEFIYENLVMQNNIIHNSYLNNVKRLIFLGSSCIYPKMSKQPIKEDYLMTGPLEETNSPYAIAKIAGVEMCWSYNRQFNTEFIPVMPTNLYGPNDNFNLETSHVLPALIRKIHEAKLEGKKEVLVWGTGSAMREFLFVDDLADACIYIMEKGSNIILESKKPLINIGTGIDISINELVEIIKNIIGFKGNIRWDTSKPDGTPKKLLDISKLKKLGWHSKIELEEGILKTYDWYQKTVSVC